MDYFYNITFEIINVLGEDNINNKNAFSFLDGKFTKTNIKIILKYLKYSFGKNIYDLGICLIVIGFFLILPIISSILLLILIDYRKKQKLENTNSDKLSNIINSSKNGGDHKRNDRLKISPYNPNFNLTHYSHDTKEEILSHQEENDEYDAETLWNKIQMIQKKIKIKKLKINIIFFKEVNENFDAENFELFNELKVKVLGGCCCAKEITIFEELVQKLGEKYKKEKDNKNKYSFILISTGSSFENIETICKDAEFIRCIIIYCIDVNKYKKQYKLNKKIKLISDNIIEIRKELEDISYISQDFSKKINNKITRYPFISQYEYENYYFHYHKMFSLFFKNDLEELDFCEGYKKKIFEFIKNNTKYNNTKIKKLIKTINNMGKRNDFLIKALEFYTSENGFVYFINRIMRQIDRGETKLSFLIGPMYYSLIRYVKRNPKFALQKDTILYRNIVTNLYDLNVFNMAKNKIICFPSFTSTSLKKTVLRQLKRH